jgi:hypothetical protein
MKLGMFVKVVNMINRGNFGGCMCRGLISAKDRI